MVKLFWYMKRYYILLQFLMPTVMVTINSHIFINIFQTLHFSDVNEKKYEVHSDSKISESLIKIWSNRTQGSFKQKFCTSAIDKLLLLWKYVTYCSYQDMYYLFIIKVIIYMLSNIHLVTSPNESHGGEYWSLKGY